MFIDVTEIGPDGLRIDTAVRAAQDSAGAGEHLRWGRAHLRGTARRGRDGVELSARLEAGLSTECNRCLGSVDLDISADFTIMIVPGRIDYGARDHELDPEEALQFEAPDGKLDLDLVAREQAYLALPLKVLCGPDCRGLCPACGVNRNRLECDCETRPIDPRWASLSNLRKGMGDA